MGKVNNAGPKKRLLPLRHSGGNIVESSSSVAQSVPQAQQSNVFGISLYGLPIGERDNVTVSGMVSLPNLPQHSTALSGGTAGLQYQQAFGTGECSEPARPRKQSQHEGTDESIFSSMSELTKGSFFPSSLGESPLSRDIGPIPIIGQGGTFHQNSTLLILGSSVDESLPVIQPQQVKCNNLPSSFPQQPDLAKIPTDAYQLNTIQIKFTYPLDTSASGQDKRIRLLPVQPQQLPLMEDSTEGRINTRSRSLAVPPSQSSDPTVCITSSQPPTSLSQTNPAQDIIVYDDTTRRQPLNSCLVTSEPDLDPLLLQKAPQTSHESFNLDATMQYHPVPEKAMTLKKAHSEVVELKESETPVSTLKLEIQSPTHNPVSSQFNANPLPATSSPVASLTQIESSRFFVPPTQCQSIVATLHSSPTKGGLDLPLLLSTQPTLLCDSHPQEASIDATTLTPTTKRQPDRTIGVENRLPLPSEPTTSLKSSPEKSESSQELTTMSLPTPKRCALSAFALDSPPNLANASSRFNRIRSIKSVMDTSQRVKGTGAFSLDGAKPIRRTSRSSFRRFKMDAVEATTSHQDRWSSAQKEDIPPPVIPEPMTEANQREEQLRVQQRQLEMLLMSMEQRRESEKRDQIRQHKTATKSTYNKEPNFGTETLELMDTDLSPHSSHHGSMDNESIAFSLLSTVSSRKKMKQSLDVDFVLTSEVKTNLESMPMLGQRSDQSVTYSPESHITRSVRSHHDSYGSERISSCDQSHCTDRISEQNVLVNIEVIGAADPAGSHRIEEESDYKGEFESSDKNSSFQSNTQMIDRNQHYSPKNSKVAAPSRRRRSSEKSSLCLSEHSSEQSHIHGCVNLSEEPSRGPQYSSVTQSNECLNCDDDLMDSLHDDEPKEGSFNQDSQFVRRRERGSSTKQLPKVKLSHFCNKYSRTTTSSNESVSMSNVVFEQEGKGKTVDPVNQSQVGISTGDVNGDDTSVHDGTNFGTQIHDLKPYQTLSFISDFPAEMMLSTLQSHSKKVEDLSDFLVDASKEFRKFELSRHASADSSRESSAENTLQTKDNSDGHSFPIFSVKSLSNPDANSFPFHSSRSHHPVERVPPGTSGDLSHSSLLTKSIDPMVSVTIRYDSFHTKLPLGLTTKLQHGLDMDHVTTDDIPSATAMADDDGGTIVSALSETTGFSQYISSYHMANEQTNSVLLVSNCDELVGLSHPDDLGDNKIGKYEPIGRTHDQLEPHQKLVPSNEGTNMKRGDYTTLRSLSRICVDNRVTENGAKATNEGLGEELCIETLNQFLNEESAMEDLRVGRLNADGAYDGLHAYNRLKDTQHAPIFRHQTKSLISDQSRKSSHGNASPTIETFNERDSEVFCYDQPASATSRHSYVGERNVHVLGDSQDQFADNPCFHLPYRKTDSSRDDPYIDTNNSAQEVRDSIKHPDVINLFASSSPRFDFSNLSSNRGFDRIGFGGEKYQSDSTINLEEKNSFSHVELNEDTTEEMTTSKSTSFISPIAPMLKEEACPANEVSESPTMKPALPEGNSDQGLQISGFLSTLSSSLPGQMSPMLLKGHSDYSILRNPMQVTPTVPLEPQPEYVACFQADLTDTLMYHYEVEKGFDQHQFVSDHPIEQQRNGYQHQQHQASKQCRESLGLHLAQLPFERPYNASETQDAQRDEATRQADNIEKISESYEPVSNAYLATSTDFIPFNEMENTELLQSRAYQNITDISNGETLFKGGAGPSDGSMELNKRSQSILSLKPEVSMCNGSRIESELETEPHSIFSFPAFFGHVAGQVAEQLTEMIGMKERHTNINHPISEQSQRVSVASVQTDSKSAAFVSYEEARARFRQDNAEDVTNVAAISTNHKESRLHSVNRRTEQQLGTSKSLQSRFGRRRSSGEGYSSLHSSSVFDNAQMIMQKESSNYFKEYMQESGCLGKVESECSKPYDVKENFPSQMSTPTTTFQNIEDASHSTVVIPALREKFYNKQSKHEHTRIVSNLDYTAGTFGFWYLQTPTSDSPVSEIAHDVEQVSTNEHSSSVDHYEVDAAIASRYDNSLSILGPTFKKNLARIRDAAKIPYDCIEELKLDNKTEAAMSESEIKALSIFGPRLKGKVTDTRVKASLADDSDDDECPNFEIPSQHDIPPRPKVDREDIESLESESSLFTTSSDERRRATFTNFLSKVRSTSDSSSIFSESDRDSNSVSNSYSDSDSYCSGSSSWSSCSRSYSNEDVRDDQNVDDYVPACLENQGCAAKHPLLRNGDNEKSYTVDTFSRESVLSDMQYQNQIENEGNRFQEGDVHLFNHDLKPESEATQDFQGLQRQESTSLFVRVQQMSFAGMANQLWGVKDAVKPEFHNNEVFENWDFAADSNDYDLAKFALDSEDFDVEKRKSENESRLALSTGDSWRTRRVRRKKSRGVESEGCAQKWSHTPRIYIVAMFGFIIMLTIIFSTSLSGLSNNKVDPRPSFVATTAPSGAPMSIVFGSKNWSQVGDTLQGIDQKDQNGFSISISDDGTRLAVGARRASTDGIIRRGNVRIYHIVVLSGKPSWTEEASFDGDNAGDQFGFSVKLSADGLRLAAGSIGGDTVGSNSGLVRMFGLNAKIWKPIGELSGENPGDLFGLSIDLSANGRLLCVGAPYHSGNNLVRSGKVYFYEDLSDDGVPLWKESRSQLFGTSVGDWFGWSVTLNADASRVAIGAPSTVGSALAGYVRIYGVDSAGTVWNLLGQDVSINNGGDKFGFSLSMDGVGDRVAVGAYRSLDTGQVNVFKFANDTWLPLGEPLVGVFPDEDFGFSVSLSTDGNYVAVGAPSQNNSHGGMGVARVFEYQPMGSWMPSFDIMGEGKAQLGGSVSLTTDATNVAVGLPAANEARVYA